MVVANMVSLNGLPAFTFLLTSCALASSDGNPGTPLDDWLSRIEGASLASMYSRQQVDLNDDGLADWLVLVKNRHYCGTGGCTLFVIEGTASGWESVGRIPTSREPFGVLETRTNGYRDIVVSVAGGGGLRGTARIAFKDGKYGPSKTDVMPS